MSATYPNPIAGSEYPSAFAPFDLLAGEATVETDRATVASGQNLAQFQVVAMNASGELVAWNPAATATVTDGDATPGGTLQIPVGASRAIGIMTQAVNATSGALPGAFYRGGNFNHEALVWPGSVTTLAARRAAFAGTPITVSQLIRDSGFGG